MKLYSILALLSITGLYVSTYSLKPGPSITKDEKGPAVYCSPSFDPKNINSPAPLLKGLGNINYPVTTSPVQGCAFPSLSQRFQGCRFIKASAYKVAMSRSFGNW